LAIDITLHVGLPKTGSSTLQRHLYMNREVLRRQGVDYPQPDRSTDLPKHQFLTTGLLRNNSAHLAGVLAAADRPSLIMSTEGLSNHLYDFSVEALAAFREITRAHTLRCVLILRAPESWLLSYYKQIIINPRVGIPGVWFYGTDITLDAFCATARAQALTDHEQLPDDIAAAYGAKSVIVLQLEEDWIAGFDRALGLDSNAWSPTPRENESAPGASIEILRQVNAHDLPESERMTWKAALQAFSGTNHTLLKSATRQLIRGAVPRRIDPGILAALRPDQQAALPLSQETLCAFRNFVHEQFPVSGESTET